MPRKAKPRSRRAPGRPSKKVSQAQAREREIEVAFGAALSEMRAHTHQEVSEILEDVPLFYRQPLALQADRITREVRQTEALYDGILDALARDIISRSYGGEERLLAEKVGERLMDIVEIHACAGTA